MTTSRITAEAFKQVLRDGMPSGAAMPFEVVTLERGRVVIRLPTGKEDLRPGDTVSGPVLFQLADLAVYAAVMTVVGPVPLAVTTDATVHFLRKPRAGFLGA
jgi:acyl-coenzyme A thioesterase PaaI-like protein